MKNNLYCGQSFLDRVMCHILDTRVYEVAKETPLTVVPKLSEEQGRNVWLKREDMQPVFSFKLRGAYQKIANLPAGAKKRGVIAASAGNHAQGVALAAAKLGLYARIVMPATTPQIKIQAVKRYGAEVVLHGDTFDEAAALAMRTAEENGLTMVHPYDDPDVIAGQGTIGLELLRQAPNNLAEVYIPVGGGGLLAGVAACIKRVRPKVRIIAVEPEDAACFAAAMAAGEPVDLPGVGIFADGVAVSRIGTHTFAIARGLVDEVVTVSTDAICAAVKDIFEATRCIAEPAGALALAGLKKVATRPGYQASGDAVALLSGANMNFHRLRHVSERTEYAEGSETILAVTIPETQGSFKRFCEHLGNRAITEFNYRFGDKSQAHIFVGIRLEPDDSHAALCHTLHAKGYDVLDLSNNELAKLHLRHMVGGRSTALTNERLFRFVFPERPGALLRFLKHLGSRWNISLFHYRNHGAAYGRVLAGFQVPDAQRRTFYRYLDELRYPYEEETENPAYQLFLASNEPGDTAVGQVPASLKSG